MIRFLVLPLALSTAVACVESQTQEPTVDPVVPVAKIAAAEPTEPAAAPAQSNSDLPELVRTIQPQKARNGSLRFSDAQLVHPEAAPLLIERLEHGNDGEEVRIALIGALPGTQGEYAAWAVQSLKNERSETVRAALVDTMRLASDSAVALEGLALGLADKATPVRIRAAFATGRRADGLSLAAALVNALGDRNTELQATAARALGNLGASDTFEKVLALLGSKDSNVRLESLRALGRINAERASTLPQLGALAKDSDERIRTAAAKVAAQGYAIKN